PYTFRKYGKSGLEVSELFHRTAMDHADSLCVIRSMHADVPNHEPSLMLMNCGDGRLPRPSMGAWVTYGLGTGNQNLPGFVVLCPGGLPIVGVQNWRSAFLPGAYQGTHVDTQHTEVQKLIEHIRNPVMTPAEQRKQLDLVKALNEIHLSQRPGDAMLEARIQSFELAYRMQTEAAEAFDVTREPQKVRAMYGTGTHGRQLLITRRLLERGVKGGTAYGATDEFGFDAVENKVHVHDLHATILYLLGVDHEKVTYRYAGRDFRLTDVHGRVVKDILT